MYGDRVDDKAEDVGDGPAGDERSRLVLGCRDGRENSIQKAEDVHGLGRQIEK